jgi:hypothetical protein
MNPQHPFYQRPTLIFEMLDTVARQPTYNDRIRVLSQLRCFELNTILQINYRPDVKLDLPPGPIQFQRDNGDPDQSMGRTKNIIPEFKYLDSRDKSLNVQQKIKKFTAMCESVNEREAEVFMLIKDKKLQTRWPFLNEALIRQAIPGII